jgi:predicted DNA-binding protein
MHIAKSYKVFISPMRTTKVYSITMPPNLAKQAERLARKENRTMSELMREAFRRYAQDTARQQQLQDLKLAVNALREEAKQTGADKLTMRQINAEIAAGRESRPERKRVICDSHKLGSGLL